MRDARKTCPCCDGIGSYEVADLALGVKVVPCVWCDGATTVPAYKAVADRPAKATNQEGT